MGDSVESFGKVEGHDGGSGGGLALVKAPRNGFGDGEESGGGGPGRSETVLGVGEAEVSLEVGEHKSLEDLDGGGEEGDGSVGGPLIVGFAGFGDGYYCGLAPDGRDVGVGYGEIEEVGEVADGSGT